MIFSKLYFGVLSKSLEELEIERYFSILYFLKANNGCSQQHICNHLGIDKTAMVKMMDYLIKAEYILRKVNPQDRREHFIVLTKKGQKRTGEIVTAFHAIDDYLFSKASKTEKAAFNKTLSTFSETIKLLPGNALLFNYQKAGRNRQKKEIKNKTVLHTNKIRKKTKV